MWLTRSDMIWSLPCLPPHPLTCSLALDHSQTSHLLNGVNVYPSFRPPLRCCFLRANFPGLYFMLFHKTVIIYPYHLPVLQFYIYLWNYLINSCLSFRQYLFLPNLCVLSTMSSHGWLIIHICRMSESPMKACAPSPL